MSGMIDYLPAPLRNHLLSSTVVQDTLITRETIKAQKGAAEREMEARLFRQARAFLMTSDRATPPRWNTMRRMIRLMAANGPVTRGARIQRGEAWVHPTKARAAWK
jgi:hypothetical protein